MTELNNFMSAFEGLSSIYEEESKQAELRRRSRRPRVITESKLREKAEETKDLVEVEEPVEPVEPEETPITPTEDTVVESIPSQVILECANCGALSIKALDDVISSDDSDLVNIEEECSFCEAAEGYKVIGDFIPKVEEAADKAEEENEEIIEDSEDEIEIEDDEVIE